MIVIDLFESQEQKQDRALFEQWRGVGQTLVELKMSEKQILDLFSRVETGVTAAGGNRTMLGKGKDVATNVASTVSNAVKGVLNAIQTSTPVQAVDVAYDQATDALAKVAGGQKGKVMQAIKTYRNLAKQYPKTAGFAKAALVAVAGLATGGAGLPAIAGLTYALDSAVKGDKLSSVLGKGAGAAALAAAGQAIAGTTQSTPADQGVPTDTTQLPSDGQEGQLVSWSQGVVPGDTLSGIAKKYNVSVDELLKANPQITNPDVLKVGDSIQIPTYNFQGDQWGSGLPTYDKGVGTYADTLAKVKSGAYTDSPISRRGLKESLGFVALTLPADKMIDHKATHSQQRIKENVDLKNIAVVLTTAGTYKIFENIDRLQDHIREARPAFFRPDMPGGPGKKSKPGVIGRGLNWLDKKAGQVGSALGSFGHQLTTKLTKEKLKMDWHQAGKPSDSDAISAFLVKQGVPQEVISDIYGQMGIPYTATAAPAGVSSTTRKTSLINPATGKSYTNAELRALSASDTQHAQDVKDKIVTDLKPKQPAAQPAPAAPAPQTTTAGLPAWADPKSSQYVGRREVARRQAAQQPAQTRPNFAPQQGYSSVKMNAPVGANLPTMTRPTVSTTPRVTAGGPTPAERQALEKRIQQAAKKQPAVAECVRHVSQMLESVKTKKDIADIRKYIDSQLVRENQQEFRQALHQKVTEVSAIKRRIAAQKAVI